MDKSLHKRFQEMRDDLGIAINKVANKIDMEPTKLYNFTSGSGLTNNDAIKLHELLKDYGY